VLVVPCCNFWSQETKLGRNQLIEQISEFHTSRGGKSERVVLDFRGPKNHGLILLPSLLTGTRERRVHEGG
jgi:hypothetical protein